MVTETKESVLRKTPLFAQLTPTEMRTLCMHATKRYFGRGEVLFAEGDQCKGLFVVATGTIRIFKLSPTGREQVLAVEGPGCSFAELPVFDGGLYPASACAVEDAEVLFISRTDFQSYCLAHPEVALKVLAVIGSRLRRLVVASDVSSAIGRWCASRQSRESASLAVTFLSERREQKRRMGKVGMDCKVSRRLGAARIRVMIASVVYRDWTASIPPTVPM